MDILYIYIYILVYKIDFSIHRKKYRLQFYYTSLETLELFQFLYIIASLVITYATSSLKDENLITKSSSDKYKCSPYLKFLTSLHKKKVPNQ